jgi:GNAT superfamily N-acetyltransferase
MSYEIQQVRSDREFQAFLNLPHRLYQHDPEWVPPLERDLRHIFSARKNPHMQRGEATQFLLRDDHGAVVGRIAAFYHHERAYQEVLPTGGMGFFECINNRDAAFKLFEAAQAWLAERGMEAMDGPINFGENDRYWGLLVDGFSQPSYGTNYNPPYYQTLFEAYGFQHYFKQISRTLPVDQPFPERMQRIHERQKNRHKISVQPLDKRRKQQFARWFREIFNDAWRFHPNFHPMSPAQVDATVKEMLPVLIEEAAVFAFVDGEPAGFLIALPDLNQIFRPLQGQLSLQEGLKFLWRRRKGFAYYRKRGQLDRLRIVIMGVRPKFQKMGVETALILEPQPKLAAMGFREAEISWVGEFNPKMQSLAEATGATYSKTHYTYRFIFDPAKREQFAPLAEVPMGTPYGQAAEQAQGRTALG